MVFDLDNTVIEAKQTMGSDQFFGYLVTRAKSQGLEEREALLCALNNATLVQPVTHSQPVETYTPKLIRALQTKNIKTIALTARPFEWAEGTLSQLCEARVNFNKTKILSSAVESPDFAAHYKNGILFMKKLKDKGAALRQFVEQSGISFKKVLFIDDKNSNVQSVETAFSGSSVVNVNFRYGAADPKVKGFNPKIADAQWQYFMRDDVFLSDETALQKIQSGEEISELTLSCDAH